LTNSINNFVIYIYVGMTHGGDDLPYHQRKFDNTRRGTV